MARLSSGVEESGLGDGTRLAEALRLALEEIDSERSADPDLRRVVPIPRLILISDGLIEDRTAAGAGVERLAEAGVALSCIGVGDQFDEEWLMWASDMTRGRFRYAPSADALETILAGEIDRLEQTVARRLSLRLRPLSGALLRDLYQVSPDLSPLQRLETDGFDRSYCLGDLGRDQEAMFLAELSLPVLAAGQRPVLAAELTAAGPEGEPLSSVETEAIIQAATDLGSEAIDPADLEAVAAVHAHRTERKAQRALRSGRIREATRHLRDTRQIAERFGRLELAADLEAEAAALENGATVSADLAKRVKAETRRLMGA
jgi:Ca-activated chloride channel family protein